LLIGGIGFSCFSFFISTLLAMYFDSDQMRAYPMRRTFNFYLIRWLVTMRFWSLIFNPILLLVMFFLFLLTKKNS
jgi:hypothetical protein